MATMLAAASVIAHNEEVEAMSRRVQIDDREKEEDWVEHEEVADDEKKIRLRILNAYGDKDLSMGIMRQLFRLLDDDGSGELSANEIQRGMMLMKFDEAKDPVALSRLLVDIDDDKTGTITEKEFLSFFVQHTRESLKTHMAAYICTRVFIRATFYSIDGADNRAARSVIWTSGPDMAKNLATLKQWIESNKLSEGGEGAGERMWLDIVGYEVGIFEELSKILNLGLSVLADALIFQAPAIKSVKNLKNYECGAQTVVHAMQLSQQPLKERPPDLPQPFQFLKSIFFRVEDASGLPEYIQNLKLVQKDDISDAAISLEQCSIISISDAITLSLRCPGSEPEGKKSHGHGHGHGHEPHDDGGFPTSSDPFAIDESGIRELFEGIHKQILNHAHSKDIHYVFNQSAKCLSVALVSEILNSNYAVRDSLQDWEECLDGDVRKKTDSGHVTHLEAIENVTRTFQRVLKPLATSLDPTNEKTAWYGVEEGEEGEEKKVPVLLKTATARATMIRSGSLSPNGLSLAEILSDSKSKEEKKAFLLDFYALYLGEFTEIAADINTVIGNMEAKLERIENIGKLLVTLKSDMMNRTLYALTLITALYMPVGFLTGLYGMNFTNIPELQGPFLPGACQDMYPDEMDKYCPDDPHKWVHAPNPDFQGFGYYYFWALLLTILFSISYFMYKQGLFDALF